MIKVVEGKGTCIIVLSSGINSNVIPVFSSLSPTTVVKKFELRRRCLEYSFFPHKTG